MFTDKIATEDLLNHKHYSETIAAGIYSSAFSSNDGFVVGLSGRWGTGKSTLLNFIKSDLQALLASKSEISEVIFIDFNPWMFTDAENIKTLFLTEISRRLKKEKLKYSFRLLKKLWKIIAANNLFPGSEYIADLPGLLDKYLDNNTSSFYKERIDDCLINSSKRLFVFIDDIDRLYPKQVFEILQVLKLTGNFKNTFYILAFDREAVEISIETQFKDYGRKYLDKIIQVDFLVPEAPSEKLEVIFFENLRSLLSSLKVDYNSSQFSSLWLHRGLKHYFKTLRDIYRFFNTLQFTLPKIALDVDITDFLLIEALRMYDFESYTFIHSEYSFRKSSFTAVEKMTSEKTLLNFQKSETKKIVEYLFPDNINPLKDYSNQKRLYDPKHFDKYFTLSVSSVDVTEVEFQQIILYKDDRLNRLRLIMSLGRLSNLIYRLNDNTILKYYKDWDFSIIEHLYQFFDEVGEGIPDITSYTDAIVNLLSVKDKERVKYYSNFLNLLTRNRSRYSVGVTYFSHFIILDKDQSTGFAHNSPSFKEFYLDHHSEIKTHYQLHLMQWRTFVLSKKIHEPLSTFTMLFIYDFAKLYPSDYRTELKILLEDESNLSFFMKNVLRINALDNKPFEINKDNFAIYLPGEFLERFILQVATLNPLTLSDEQKQWRDFILQHEIADTKMSTTNYNIEDAFPGIWESQFILYGVPKKEVEIQIINGKYYTENVHWFNIEDIFIDMKNKKIKFKKEGLRNDSRQVFNDLDIVEFGKRYQGSEMGKDGVPIPITYYKVA